MSSIWLRCNRFVQYEYTFTGEKNIRSICAVLHLYTFYRFFIHMMDLTFNQQWIHIGEVKVTVLTHCLQTATRRNIN